jgi:hypothetical protein
MNAVNVVSMAANFPLLQALQHQRAAEAAPAADVVLVLLCTKLREEQQDKSHFVTIEPQSWESFGRDAAALNALIRGIADTPATSRVGLRAKALALHALLDEGGGSLCEDAAAPDLLAWSLVQDILAD